MQSKQQEKGLKLIAIYKKIKVKKLEDAVKIAREELRQAKKLYG